MKKGGILIQKQQKLQFIHLVIPRIMNEVRMVRKFNCKQKIKYQEHLWLIFRTQLVYELVIIIVNCVVNMSLHFHLSHLYTTEFWTSENIASSNFGLALSSLLMITYTVRIEEAKGILVKDLHFTMLLIHIILCFFYSHFSLTFSYILFACVIGALSIAISSFVANVMEQKKLHKQIMEIERQDRMSYKKVQIEEHQIHEETPLQSHPQA